MSFIEAFRRLSQKERKRRDLQLYDITHRAQRSESAISKWESGETVQPDHLDSLLDGYAQAFGMPTTDFIELIAQAMGDEPELESTDEGPGPLLPRPESEDTQRESRRKANEEGDVQ